MLGASNRRIGKSDLSREADAMFDLFPDIRRLSRCARLDLVGRPTADGRGGASA